MNRMHIIPLMEFLVKILCDHSGYFARMCLLWLVEQHLATAVIFPLTGSLSQFEACFIATAATKHSPGS